MDATDKMNHLLFMGGSSLAPNVFELSCGPPKLRAAPHFSRSKTLFPVSSCDLLCAAYRT
jgi:hypothetical protein